MTYELPSISTFGRTNMQICVNVFEFDKQTLVDPHTKETAAGYFREEQKTEVSFKNFLCIYICALSEQ